MRFFLFFLFFSTFSNISSQVNTAEYSLKNGESIMYFDADWNIITEKSKAEFYRIFKLGANNQSEGEVKDYFKTGQIQNSLERASYIDINDDDKWIFEGLSVVYFDSGEIEEEYNYINNKKEGKKKVYYKSGKIKSIENYENGIANGKYISFYESGLTYIEYESINGNIEGDWIAYRENGKIEQTVSYVNDKKEGILKDFNESGELNFVIKYYKGEKLTDEAFYPSGSTKYIWKYKNGKENGIAKKFYESGEIKEIVNYLDGILNGKNIIFFRNGNEAENYDYKNGEITNSHVKDKFGNTIWKSNNFNKKLTIFQPTKDGEDIDDINEADEAGGYLFEKEPWESSLLNFHVIIKDGISQYMTSKNHKIKNKQGDIVWEGMSYTYHDNGQVATKLNYRNDEKDGEEIFYDRSGTITNKIFWNNGTRDNWSLDCSTTPCEYSFKSYFTDKATAESEGWSFYDDEEENMFVPSSPEEAKGTYYWEKKDNGGRIQSIKLPISDNENFQVSTIVNWWKGVTNYYFGLVVGYKDWENYVALRITANGSYQAEIINKGINVGMQDSKEVDVYYKSPTKLNIVREGGTLYFSIDNQLIYTSEYSSLPGGYLGFYNEGIMTVTYDNFKAIKSANSATKLPRDKGSDNYDWNGNGSGIIISRNGLVATNFHVIDGAQEIELEFNYRNEVKRFKAKVLRVDETNDLAILKIDDPSFSGLSSINYNFKTRASQVGESVFALGYPKALTSMGKDIKFTDGKISSKTGYQGNVTTYQTTTPIQPGNSGGPLFDYKGNLIGINSSKIVSDDVDNVSYTIKSSYLLTLIDLLNEDIALPANTSISSLPLTSKIELLSKYVTLIKVR